MITLRTYQEKAVNRLLEDTYSLLKLPGTRQKMIFKAPTGSGKTVTMAAYLNKLSEELPDELSVPIKKIAFIWIAPNQLHLQSFISLKNYFEELRSIKPIQFEDVSDSKLQPNEVLFLNWQSVNKDGNLYIRDNEQDKTLLKYINNARLEGTEIIIILDEAHLFATKGKAAKELLHLISGKIEIDVSATPLFENAAIYKYTINRQEVVEAEMIKKGVILNPDVDDRKQKGDDLNHVLLKLALKKREEIAAAYKEIGVNINPLLLIQLPNDSKSETVYDLTIKDTVMQFMTAKGITTENHRMAVWLSKGHVNLEGIEDFQSITDVLLFKQAISLGWDCPRAAVLLIFREIKQETFTIQTVGRILRMPQQKHYTNGILNNGYVYTDLSRDMIQVVQDDMDYLVFNKAMRIKEYQQVQLNSAFINTRLVRNRLSSKFRKCMYEAAEDYFGVTRDMEKTNGEALGAFNQRKLQEKLIETDVEKIVIPIPKGVELSGEIEKKRVAEMENFAKTQLELDILFRQFCRDHVGGYAKVDSTPVLEMSLKMLFEEYFEIDEFKAVKIILYAQNKPQFAELIDIALQKHEELLKEKASKASKRIEPSKWDVPPEKIFSEHFDEKQTDKSALLPFFEFKNASNPERQFVAFLEVNKAYFDWWYKNGDKNKEDFAIIYQDKHSVERGFYVDFVIKLKNGKIALFDTKTLESDTEFVNKHNALIKYIEDNTTEEKPLIGGVIVPVHDAESRLWKYCPNRIDTANDTRGWIAFLPQNMMNNKK